MKGSFSALNITISSMNIDDIHGVLSVQKINILSQPSLNNKQLPLEGFLVYPTSSNDLQQAINDPNNHILLVAKNDQGEVVGYVLSYSLNSWRHYKPQWDNMVDIDQKYKKIFNQKTLYVKHIARKPIYKGVGSLLEIELLKRANGNGYQNIIAEIIETPIPNDISTVFHKNFGYVKIGIINDLSNNRVWGLYQKSLK